MLLFSISTRERLLVCPPTHSSTFPFESTLYSTNLLFPRIPPLIRSFLSSICVSWIPLKYIGRFVCITWVNARGEPILAEKKLREGRAIKCGMFLSTLDKDFPLFYKFSTEENNRTILKATKTYKPRLCGASGTLPLLTLCEWKFNNK